VKLLATTLSLTVPDPAASSAFLVERFGFHEDLAFDGGAALSHPDGGPTLFFMRQGIETLPEAQRGTLDQGVVLALTVEDLDAEEARLRAEGVTPLAPVLDDEWGERSFQVAGPNGLFVQLVGWVGERPY
jgi:catechol 2,3-dioxygenase-like lactoylglutathione lyase family enzyme